jgi:hypothetical protein
MWSNPGFMIDIEAEEINKKDIEILELSLKDQNYSLFSTREKENFGCNQYSKAITADEQIKHPAVTVLICYDDNKELGRITKFGILIMNEWEGQKPQIKQEIQRIGNILYAELIELVGKENVTIERKATGPPF